MNRTRFNIEWLIGLMFVFGCGSGSNTTQYTASEMKITSRLSRGLATQTMKARRVHGFPVLFSRGADIASVLIVVASIRDMDTKLEVSGATVERLCLSDLKSQVHSKQSGIVIRAYVRRHSSNWPSQLTFRLRYSSGSSMSGSLPLRFFDKEEMLRSYGAIIGKVSINTIPTETPPIRFEVVEGAEVARRAVDPRIVVVDRLIGGRKPRALIGTRE